MDLKWILFEMKMYRSKHFEVSQVAQEDRMLLLEPGLSTAPVEASCSPKQSIAQWLRWQLCGNRKVDHVLVQPSDNLQGPRSKSNSWK